jgi:hypothetical protein
LAKFTRQLGAMLDANVEVLRALRVSGQLTGNPRLLEATKEVSLRLEDGREFHRAITTCPDLFDPFYVEMARQGESDGQLGKALLSLADYLERISVPQPEPVVQTIHTGPSAGVAGLTMATLGVLSIGAAVVWGMSATRWIPLEWTGPVAAFWSGVCLLGGAWLLRRVREPKPGSAPTLPDLLPEPLTKAEPAPVAAIKTEKARPTLTVDPGESPHKPGTNGTRPKSEGPDDRVQL